MTDCPSCGSDVVAGMCTRCRVTVEMPYTSEPSELVTAIMNRDNVSRMEAEDLVDFMRELVQDGEDPSEVLHDEGFEPDYILDLI